MDKKQRRDKEFYLYKKRVQRWVANLSTYICRDGSRIRNPKAIDVLNDKGQLRFKQAATICSCYGCSGYYKYRRNEKRLEDRRLIEEYKRD